MKYDTDVILMKLHIIMHVWIIFGSEYSTHFFLLSSKHSSRWLVQGIMYVVITQPTSLHYIYMIVCVPCS